MTRAHKPVVKILTSAIMGILACNVNAAGFSVYGEGNGINASNFAAGSAAEVHDASTAWYNPAGLALLHSPQVVSAGTGILASGKASGTATYTSFTAANTPSPAPTNPYKETFNDLQGGKNAFIPAFHYSHPINADSAFGISVVTPYGLATKWREDSAVRYNATNSELLTINVAPSVGAKVHENVAIGLGIDVQYAAVTFNKVIGAPVYSSNSGLPASYVDSTSHNEGDSVGVGFHAGVLGLFNDNHTRVGVNYQSKMRHKFNGHSTLTGRLADPTFDPLVPLTANPLAVNRNNDLQSNTVDFPAVTTLSAFHDVNDDWAVMGSLVYTQWKSVSQIVLTNVAGPVSLGGSKLQSNSLLNYKNAWRAALGANYKLNEAFTFRFGGGYDETPTNDTDRDMRLPDANRWTIALGGDYQVRDDISIGFGWTHFFFDTGRVNKSERALSLAGGTGGYAIDNIQATASTNADLFGAQLVWTMDKEVVMDTK